MHGRISLATVCLVLIALGTVALAQGPGELRPGETRAVLGPLFPETRPTDDEGTPTHSVIQLLDAVTKRPIPNAEIRPSPHHWGQVLPDEPTFSSRKRADSDTFVRVPWAAYAEYRDYVIGDAPGYAASEDCLPWNNEEELKRGVDVPVLLLDYRGRPVPGARLGFNLGCMHIPDQRNLVTDAAGRGVFREIDPERLRDIFAVGPGIHSGSLALSRTWNGGREPVAIHAPPGVVIRGRVLDGAGRPCAGLRVEADGGIRAARLTDEEGRYEIPGLSSRTFVQVFDKGERVAIYRSAPDGREQTLRIGEKEEQLTTRWRLLPPPPARPEPVRLDLIRKRDGLCRSLRSDETGTATLKVPAGDYEVRVDGELGPWRDQTLSVLIDTEHTEFEVALRPARRLRLDWGSVAEDDLDTIDSIGLTTATRFRLLSPDDISAADGLIPHPEESPAYLRIAFRAPNSGLSVRYSPLPAPGATLEKPFPVVLPPVTTLRARAVDASGRPIEASLSCHRREPAHEDLKANFGHDDSSLTPTTRCYGRGIFYWSLVPEEPDDAPATVLEGVYSRFESLPENGVVDLGTIVLSERRPVNLVIDLPTTAQDFIDSQPSLSYITAYGTHRDRGVDVEETAEGHIDLIYPDLVPGGEIHFDLNGDWTNQHFRLSGPAPWKFEIPKTTLTIEAVDAAGKPVASPCAIVDGEQLSCEARAPVAADDFEEPIANEITIRGLAAGRRVVIIHAADRPAVRLELDIKKGEARRLRVTLP